MAAFGDGLRAEGQSASDIVLDGNSGTCSLLRLRLGREFESRKSTAPAVASHVRLRALHFLSCWHLQSRTLRARVFLKGLAQAKCAQRSGQRAQPTRTRYSSLVAVMRARRVS